MDTSASNKSEPNLDVGLYSTSLYASRSFNHPNSSAMRILGIRWWQICCVIITVIGCILLAWWQWTRFQSASGNFQNLGYALQWPAFGLFAIYAYRQFLILDQKKRQTDMVPQYSNDTSETSSKFSSKKFPNMSFNITQKEVPDNFLPSPPEISEYTEIDPELDAYNKYLQSLAENTENKLYNTGNAEQKNTNQR